MTAPVRLQLSRRKGFDLQAVSRSTNGLAAVNVARPSRWGNPFKVDDIARELLKSSDWSFADIAGYAFWQSFMQRGAADRRQAYAPIAQRVAVELFENELRHFERTNPAAFLDFIEPLRGHNLACWCKPGQPCHADVWLRFANPE